MTRASSWPDAGFVAAPAGAAILEAIADLLNGEQSAAGSPFAMADATVFLPNRRAVRALEHILLERAQRTEAGQGVLLPRMESLGDLSDDPAEVDAEHETGLGELSPMARTFALARLIRAVKIRTGDPATAEVFALARSLGAVLDSLALNEGDPGGLDDVLDDHLTKQAQRARTILAIALEHWPEFLAEQGLQDCVARRVAQTRARAAAFKETPPQAPVILAGSTGAAPSTVTLMAAIAGLPKGLVVLPGLDPAMEEAAWKDMQDGHPHFTLKRALKRLGLSPADIPVWPQPEEAGTIRRRALLSALTPWQNSAGWRERAAALGEAADLREGLAGLSFLEARDEQEEALLVALALREALAEPGKTALLVTPDRNLAQRVQAELTRWKIDIDDSAGRPLNATAVGDFATTLLRAAADDRAAVELAHLVTHPLARFGLSQSAVKAAGEKLQTALRGPVPADGRAGYAGRLTGDAHLLYTRLDTVMTALGQVLSCHDIALSDLAAALKDAVFAATTDGEGVSTLGSDPAGDALIDWLDRLGEAACHADPVSGRRAVAVMAELMGEETQRPNRPAHPRLQILGPLEARLQHADRIVLSGLDEGVWPGRVGQDPWLTRSMRAAMGLPPPEERIGLAAHDFLEAAASGERILTRARQREGAPARPSRWLRRLETLLRAAKVAPDAGSFGERLEAGLPGSAHLHALAKALDASPAEPPAKAPAVTVIPERFPTRLRATELERLARDPYEIYAARILKLEGLETVGTSIDARAFGIAAHTVWERAWQQGFLQDPEAMESHLTAELQAWGMQPAQLTRYRPRIQGLARDLARLEDKLAGVDTHYEVKGELDLAGVRIRLRADRLTRDGSGAWHIYDLKTGKAPSSKQVQQGFNLQLQCAARALAEGGLDDLKAGPAAGLAYLGHQGKARWALTPITQDAEKTRALVENTLGQAAQALHEFRAGTRPFRSREAAEFKADSGAADVLARVHERRATGGGEEP